MYRMLKNIDFCIPSFCKKSLIISRRNYSSGDVKTQAGPKTGPLSGIRVLDITRVLAGPFASMILADLGAEVIKIEKPGVGDDTRSWGPPYIGSESTYFLSVNRNKKSIAVNLKERRGAHLVQEVCMQHNGMFVGLPVEYQHREPRHLSGLPVLSKKSDVILENYLPGKLDKLGLGYESLKELNPSLIYCSITGYGPGGPYDQRAGYDVIVSAIGGFMNITGPKDGEPCKSGVAVTDLITGLYAHGAIMAAIIERQKTGRGQKIDCSLLASQIAVLSHVATSFLNTGFKTGRYGTAHHSIVPYQAFETRDGHVLIGAGNDGLFKKLCKVMKMPDLANDPDYLTNIQRVKNQTNLLDILHQQFSNKTTKEWLSLLEDSGIPYGPINDVQQVFDDPQVKYKNMVQEVDHPTIGRLKMPGPAVEYNGETSLVSPHPPPLLGQHTKEILRDVLGYDDSQIRALHESGSVSSHGDITSN